MNIIRTIALFIKSSVGKKINNLFFSKEELHFHAQIRHDLQINKNFSKFRDQVLIEIDDTYCELIEHIALAKYFSENNNLKPAAYIPGFTQIRRTTSLAMSRYLYKMTSRGYRIARKHGIGAGLDVCQLNRRNIKTARANLNRFLTYIKDKESVLTYRIDNVDIGISIYDTYLKEMQCATVDINSKKFKIIAFEAFKILEASKAYLDSHNVRIIVLGHCVYNNWKILSDLAQSRRIQVYVSYNSHPLPFIMSTTTAACKPLTIQNTAHISKR